MRPRSWSVRRPPRGQRRTVGGSRVESHASAAEVVQRCAGRPRREGWRMISGGRRRLGLLLAAAALSVTGCAASTDVDEAAATRTAAPSTWFLDSGGVVPPSVSAPTTIVGLSPAIPRPGTFEVPRPAPYGVAPDLEPSPAPCAGYSTPKQVNPGAVPGTGSATVT